ncbi:MAG: restriction endonuclease subunit S [Alphaproteobacteria bacterium]
MAGEGEERITRTGGRAATTGVIKGRYALSVGNPGTAAPDGWTWTPLTEVARLETGHTPSRKHPEYWGGEIPWIGIRDATSNHGRTIYETQENTNALGIANSSARVLPQNTICLSRTASVGYVVVMGRPMATSQDFVNWVCSKRMDYRFLKYVLLAEKDALLQYASGTTHQTIYFPEVKAFHVCLPRQSEQARIADLLGALDDKIELNRRMAQTLEAMARALFKSWFVDFDPVRAKTEGRPTGLPDDLAALFPDRFGDDGLPSGWHFGTVDEISDLNPESWDRYNRPEFIEYVDLSSTKLGIIEQTQTFRTEDAPSRAQRVLRPGDTIIGTVRPGNNSYAHVLGDGLTGSTGFAVLRPRQRAYTGLVYLCASARSNIEELAQLADGAAYPAVRPEVVAQTPIALPDNRSLLCAFSAVADPLLSRRHLALLNSQPIRAIRDTLLPKLISGELRIADAEKRVAAAG